ncbi:preprotein translocase subunit SecY, partial [Enterococcus faecalis]
AIKEIYEHYFSNIESSRIWQFVIFIAILVIAIFVIVTVVTFFPQAERKIPIQYTKRVSRAPTSSYLPLKLNAAGV